MANITNRWDCAVARKYTKRDGTEAKQWINVGRAVEWDGKDIQIELTSVPCFPGWDGKISLFVPREKEGAKPAPKPAPNDGGFDDDLNF